MSIHAPAMPEPPDRKTRDFYLRALQVLDTARIPWLVGGAYAMAYYTGIVRYTKDMDLFVRPDHARAALDALSAAGYRTEVPWPHFLGKAIEGDAFVDILFNSGNGLAPVDDEWFDHAFQVEVLGRSAPLCPPEEMIWSKAFVQDRDRYDGADVAHLILARGQTLDWERLLRRFKNHERVLLSHLLLFGYVYPSERHIIPGHVVDRLVEAMGNEPAVSDRVCRGTLLANRSYQYDIEHWDFADARLQPRGGLTPEQIRKISA